MRSEQSTIVVVMISRSAEGAPTTTNGKHLPNGTTANAETGVGGAAMAPDTTKKGWPWQMEVDYWGP